jgi:phage shock protein PspC (stress-responsive transcriptional regulator)
MNETPAAGVEPPPPAPLPPPSSRATSGAALPPKRMYRDPHGPIGGIASGFAGYFNIDPVITRLVWVAAAFSGVGIPAYLLCWLVIPKARTWPPPEYQGRAGPSVRDQNDKALISGLAIVALAAVIGAGTQGIGDYLLPAALVGFGVFLLSQRSQTSSVQPSDAGSPTPPSPSPPAATHSRSEPTGMVTPTVLSLLAIAVGMLVALHTAGVLHVPVAAAAAGALVLVGSGLIGSLWLGRARGLVPLGLALVLVMVAASAAERYRF